MRSFALALLVTACAPSSALVTHDAAAPPDDASDVAAIDTSPVTPDAPDGSADAAAEAAVDAVDDAPRDAGCPDHAERVGAACRCVTGYTFCNDQCVDLFNDGANCGTCASLCEGGICALGRCVTVAPPVDAGSDAADAATDRPDPCGGACARLANVAEASCVAPNRCAVGRCAAGFADCDMLDLNGCETALSTRENCGACRVACSGTRTCVGGVCR